MPGEFAHDVARICHRANERVSSVVIPPLTDPRRVATALERIVAIERGALSQLRSLTPPKSEAAAVDSWLALLDQMLDEVGRAGDALRHNEVFTALDVATRAMRLDLRGRDLARALGVPACRVEIAFTRR